MISDQTDEARVGEAVREAALEALRDEIPHAVAVRIEEIVPQIIAGRDVCAGQGG